MCPLGRVGSIPILGTRGYPTRGSFFLEYHSRPKAGVATAQKSVTFCRLFWGESVYITSHSLYTD